MRAKRIVGAAVFFVGGFLIITAVLVQVWAGGALQKTPINVDKTTYLTGTAKIGADTFPIKVTNVTRTDSAKSDGQTAVWQTSSCTVQDVGNPPDCLASSDPQHRLISATIDNFATDRVSGLAVDDPQALPADAVQHEGLVNKWPFDAKQTSYPYWSNAAGKAVTTTFAGTGEAGGFTCNIYDLNLTRVPVTIAAGVQGFYTEQTQIYVEPRSGSIINQIVHQTQVTTDGSPVSDIKVEITPASIDANAKEVRDGLKKFDLLTKTVPLVGYVGGGILLLVGLAMAVLGRGPDKPSGDSRDRTDELVSA